VKRIETTGRDWKGEGGDLGQGDGIWGAISNIADRLSKGEKAIPVTEGLVAAGLVENPEKIRRIANENEEVLNRYFEQLDIEAFVRRLKIDERVAKKSSQIGRSLALVGAGGLATVLFNKFNS